MVVELLQDLGGLVGAVLVSPVVVALAGLARRGRAGLLGVG